MDWFLYDRDLHHERVQYNKKIASIKTNILLIVQTYNCNIVAIEINKICSFDQN